jgi:AcrR family transcriptional regulator
MSSYPPTTAFIDSSFLVALQERGFITKTLVRLNPLRREAIVTGILEEAALKGPTQINIKEVARRAGVSVGSLYQYFNHRQGLLDFAIEIVTRQMAEALTYFKPYLTEMPLREALKAYIQGGYELVKEYQGYIQYFMRAAYQGDPVLVARVVQPVARVMLEMTRDILDGARLRGEIRPGIDIEATSRLANTLIIAVYDAQFLPHLNTYYQLTDENVTRERILDNMLSLIENALKG